MRWAIKPFRGRGKSVRLAGRCACVFKRVYFVNSTASGLRCRIAGRYGWYTTSAAPNAVDPSISVSPDVGARIGARLEWCGRRSGWSLAAACQPGLGTAPVRTSSSATSRSLVLVRWEAWVRMVNASSSLILCRSIKMPLACSIQARVIIAVRS